MSELMSFPESATLLPKSDTGFLPFSRIFVFSKYW